MTDVWTSAGVLVGVALVVVTGWLRLDPLIALAVSVHILWTGFGLMRRSVRGLLDPAISNEDQSEVTSSSRSTRAATASRSTRCAPARRARAAS